MKIEPRAGLPTFLGPLFWDVDPLELDAEMHRDFVIARILSAGTLESTATSLGFYLAGGTAVALHVGHRRSVDFDWFAPRFPGQPVDLSESLGAGRFPAFCPRKQSVG